MREMQNVVNTISLIVHLTQKGSMLRRPSFRSFESNAQIHIGKNVSHTAIKSKAPSNQTVWQAFGNCKITATIETVTTLKTGPFGK